jgi:hypothetical protein
MEGFSAGTLAGAGSFKCEECGYAIALHELDEIPVCPRCHTGRFKRASLFAEHDTTGMEPVQGEVEVPGWLPEARGALEAAGDYLAFEQGDDVTVVRLEEEWTRLGRSLSAHVRFDDPTVSRRHALIHRQDGTARILDDRSLNGVFLNAEQVDWHELEDGDEIGIGRFRLYFISLAEDRSPATSGGIETVIG